MWQITASEHFRRHVSQNPQHRPCKPTLTEKLLSSNAYFQPLFIAKCGGCSIIKISVINSSTNPYLTLLHDYLCQKYGWLEQEHPHDYWPTNPRIDCSNNLVDNTLHCCLNQCSLDSLARPLRCSCEQQRGPHYCNRKSSYFQVILLN